MLVKKCKICGKEFTATRTNAQYCGAECRRAGDSASRLKYYNANKDIINEKRNKSRRDNTARKNKRIAEESRRRAEEFRKLDQQRKIDSMERLRERAEAGEMYAILSLYGNRSIEYWRAYQKYELDYFEKYGGKLRLVNGISILEETFPQLVLDSLAKLGSYTATLVNVHSGVSNEQ